MVLGVVWVAYGVGGSVGVGEGVGLFVELKYVYESEIIFNTNTNIFCTLKYSNMKCFVGKGH